MTREGIEEAEGEGIKERNLRNGDAGRESRRQKLESRNEKLGRRSDRARRRGLARVRRGRRDGAWTGRGRQGAPGWRLAWLPACGFLPPVMRTLLAETAEAAESQSRALAGDLMLGGKHLPVFEG